MIPLAEARRMIAAAVQPLAAETVPLAVAHGRILREDIQAGEDFPAFDRSAMDGYAVAHDDASERFAVIGEVQPGHAPELTVRHGECARIFTGAQIPQGASQVLMQEDVRREGSWITPLRRGAQTHIRHRGEDARRGTILLREGARLGAGELALLAQAGAANPRVSPAPRVLHFVTGNELVPPSAQPGPAQIRDSNSTLVAALLAGHGASLQNQRHCRDSLELLIEEIRREPPDSWDLLLISGGASVGDYDFGARALAALGFEARFQQVNLRPGKPLVFANRARQAAFVIPGNPVSHFVVFHLAIRAALEALQAAVPSWPLAGATLAAALPARKEARETYWPAHVSAAESGLAAHPLAWQSSGDLSGLVGANALIRIPGNSEAAPVGGRVECLLLNLR